MDLDKLLVMTSPPINRSSLFRSSHCLRTLVDYLSADFFWTFTHISFLLLFSICVCTQAAKAETEAVTPHAKSLPTEFLRSGFSRKAATLKSQQAEVSLSEVPRSPAKPKSPRISAPPQAGPKASVKHGSAISTRASSHVVVDEGVRDQTFVQLRTELLAAIRNRDKAFVEGILSPEVVTSIGGGTGKGNFCQQWDDLSKSSKFWQRLERVLVHGAQLDEESNEVHAPAVAFDDNHSMMPQAVVWNKTAGLYKTESDAAPMRNVYGKQINIVEPSEPAPIDQEWVRVSTADGGKGFMKAADLYSAYDEFAVFKKQEGKWTLSWFGFAGL